MKLLKTILMTVLLLSTANIFACNFNTVNIVTANDSINLLAEFSLFYEAHRNGQFDDWTLEKGWNVINNDPTQFVKYKIFTRMEEVLFYIHDSSDASPEVQKTIADTTLALYSKGIQYDKERESYYLVKKAYVLENWEDVDPQVVIDAYLAAFKLDPKIDEAYKDRLGQFYVHNEMMVNAIDWYDKLATEEPDNARWPARLESLVETPEELMAIFERSWRNDIENLEKAWKFGSMAVRVKNYEKAQESFEYLTKKAADVINYWKQLATVYEKVNETDKALNAYKTLIDLQPENRDNYVNIALIYKKINQLSVARTYLLKAAKADPEWDYPLYIEGSLYEQAARDCMGAKLEFIDKCVFLLAVDTYRAAKAKGGSYASSCAERVSALTPTIPSQEDYFFRQISDGATVKIEGGCYNWIQKSVTARF